MAVNIKKDYGDNRRPDITSLVYGKVPPQDPDAEAAVLGAMMLEGNKVIEVLDIIPSEECFYVNAHQKIYKAMRTLVGTGEPIDLLTVTNELRRSDELEIVGGAYFLVKITQGVVSSAHVESHSRMILEKYLQREVIRVSGSAISLAYEDSTDVFDLYDKVSSDLFALFTAVTGKGVAHISAVVKKVLEQAEIQRNNKVAFTGVPTGFDCLDRLTGGWQSPDLIILAARPAVGKTAFVLNLAKNAATNSLKPTPVAIFSLEMGAEQLVKRLVSCQSGIVMDKLKNINNLTPEEYARYIQAYTEIASLPMHIDDTAALTVFEFKAKLRKLKQKNGVGLVIIDYLQLMDGGKEHKGNREQEISKISRELKKTAKELEIPVIVLSQLNRLADGKIPDLSMLRESGAIEQDADIVGFLYGSSEKAIQEDTSLANKVNFDIKKHRDGAVEDFVFEFQKECQRFKEIKPFNGFAPFIPDNPSAGISRPVTQPIILKDNDDLPF